MKVFYDFTKMPLYYPEQFFSSEVDRKKAVKKKKKKKTVGLLRLSFKRIAPLECRKGVDLGISRRKKKNERGELIVNCKKNKK